MRVRLFERELEHLKEQEQKRLQEEMTRLKEEELKNKKGGKKDPKEVSTEESALERKQVCVYVCVYPPSYSFLLDFF